MKKVIFISGLFSTDRILLGLEKKCRNRMVVYSQNASESNNFKFFNLDNRYRRRSPLPYLRKLENYAFSFWDYSYYRKKKILKNTNILFSLEELERNNISIIIKYISKITTVFYKLFTDNSEVENTGLRFDHTIEKVVLMWPYDISNINVAVQAKKNKLTTVAYITGFDNISTKSRIPSVFDKVLVWSESMKREFLAWYPDYDPEQIVVTGAPQFDYFFKAEFHIEKYIFYKDIDWDLSKKICLFAVGSPNLLDELTTFYQLLKSGVFEDWNIVLRLHPGFKYQSNLLNNIRLYKNVWIQDNFKLGNSKAYQDEHGISEWISTFKNVDLIINTSSTVCLDGIICGKLVINLDFELDENGKEKYDLVKEINNSWFHVTKLLKHKAIIRVNDSTTLATLLKSKLELLLNTKAQNELLNDFFDNTLGQSFEIFANEIFE
jgi:hypothetical protein